MIPGVVNPYVNRPYENAAVAAGSRVAETVSGGGGSRQLQSSYGQQAASVVETYETRFPPSSAFSEIPPRVNEFGRGGAQQNSGAASFFVPSSQEFVTPKSFAETIVNAERGKKKKAAKRQTDDKKEDSNSMNVVAPRSIRLENEVMDVTSESVYVADVTETSEGKHLTFEIPIISVPHNLQDDAKLFAPPRRSS